MIRLSMNILAWVVFGLAVGAIAQALQPAPVRGGLLGTLVLGVLGSLLGGFLGSLIFSQQITGFNLISLVIAGVGAGVILLADRYLSRKV